LYHFNGHRNKIEKSSFESSLNNAISEIIKEDPNESGFDSYSIPIHYVFSICIGIVSLSLFMSYMIIERRTRSYLDIATQRVIDWANTSKLGDISSSSANSNRSEEVTI